MTRNTISYLELQEKKRANQASESIKRDELAETIANNLRNFKINIDKNAIQKLANDQLDQREAKKLMETIANNLRTYEVETQRNIENARNNREREKLEAELNEIKRVDSLLTAAKATGKDPVSMLISWFSNQANLAAFAGKNDFTAFYDWLTEDEGSSENAEAKNNIVRAISNGKRNNPYFESASVTYHGGGYQTKAKKARNDLVNKINKNGKYRRERDDENEIPTDFSNSRGPGERRNYETITNKTQNDASYASRSSQENSGEGTRSAGFYATQPSTDGTGRAAVYYSPGTKEAKEKGNERREQSIGIAFS